VGIIVGLKVIELEGLMWLRLWTSGGLL